MLGVRFEVTIPTWTNHVPEKVLKMFENEYGCPGKVKNVFMKRRRRYVRSKMCVNATGNALPAVSTRSWFGRENRVLGLVLFSM